MKKRTMGLFTVLSVCGITVLGLVSSGFCPGTPEGRNCAGNQGCVQVRKCGRSQNCRGTGACANDKTAVCGKSGCPVLSAASVSSKGVWGTDYQAALDAAKKNGRPVFAFFTGSDWCRWCIKLDNEVLNQEKFKIWSGRNVNLLKIDFPRGGNQSAAERKANEALMRKYGVRGFPTIVFLDKDGKEIKRTGYRQGGVDSYIKHLEDLLK